ncbi:SapC family protein [Arhodomonas sp. SL1]|uniref:SapC family protein n=1 Tax=Arhodomonas sp. SL1 TaxID=3425691 RepID=UPI003F8811E1
MFDNLEALNPERHSGLRYQSVSGFSFARGVPSAPVAGSEFPKAAREFPIVFTAEGQRLRPLALLTLQKGQAPFIGEDGQWQADYVPAHLRRYPFILGETGEEGRFVVMIDRDAPQLREAEGEALFVDGEPPEEGVVARAKRFLLQFQRELEQTEALLRPLEEHGLLVARQFTVTRGDNTEVAVSGFRMVDMERLAALDDATLAGWVRSGLMGLVHAHRHSLENAQRILARQAA